MKTLKTLLIASFAILTLVFFVGKAKAATLSQTSVYLTAGQSSTVYAYNVSTSIYLSNNTNNSVATVSISGTSINIYAITTGTTNATICEYNNGSCNNIYITVSGGSSSGNLSLSQTNLSLTVGQTSTVTAYNSYSYGTIYVSSNSNSNVATAYVSGNTISIYGNSYGTASIMVCQNNNTTYCGTIYVNVTGGYVNSTAGSGNLNLSSLTLPVGGAATINSSNSASLTVSSNSNPSVAVTSYASATPGCASGAAYSVVTGQPCYNNGGGYSSLIAGCTSTSLYSYLTGQSCFNNNGYNNSNNSNSIQILAASAGVDTITICQNGNYSCTPIYITTY